MLAITFHDLLTSSRGVVDEVRRLARQHPDKIIIEYDHVEVNSNQVTHLVNDHIIPIYGKPDLLIFIEWVLTSTLCP